MSSNLPEFPLESSPWNADPTDFALSTRQPGPTAREWTASIALLLLTLFSTSLAGLFYRVGDIILPLRMFLNKPGVIVQGFVFSIPLISILLAHELGHFLACRYYGMRCTPPFFIPAPIPLTGTFGALIKIKSQFLHRRALFDIGVAGPLAGFIIAMPLLWIGIRLSTLAPKGYGPGELSFGEPLIFRFFGALALGYSPDKQDMLAHPIAIAAWFGIFATSLNLLPIWQLDGGHVAYAIWGSSLQKKISIIFTIGLMLLSLFAWPRPWGSYLLLGLLLLVIGARVRFYHPPPLLYEERLGPGRIFVGLLVLLILIVSFTPIPVVVT